MGLDAVELIMEVEDSFGIEFEDNDVPHAMTTIGELYALVLRKLKLGHEVNQCLTAKAYYRLRKALIAETHCQRRTTHPKTSLDVVIPRKVRRKVWPKLSASMKMQLPTLLRPTWLSNILRLVGTGLLFVGVIAIGFR